MMHYLGLELKTESFALLHGKNDKLRSFVDVKKPYESAKASMVERLMGNELESR